MKIIIEATGCLSDEDAAEADRLLAAAAPGLTPSRLRAMCTRVVRMIDPKAAEERKEAAAKQTRISRWQEDSGNAALSGRELPPEEVLAASQHIDATARALQARTTAPLAPGPPGPGFPDGGTDPGGGTGSRPGRAPVKAVINLLVPIGALLGWSSAPSEIPGFGLLDPRPPVTWSRPPPGTRKPAGAPPSSAPTVPRSPTVAPQDSTPGNPARPGHRNRSSRTPAPVLPSSQHR